MAPRFEAEVSASVWQAVVDRRRRTGEDLSAIVDGALSEAFDLRRHSLFQVSTSNALVQGVFGGVITVAELGKHGDFGLGTFAGLDGELIMIDGECLRATAGGVVSRAEDDREVPFAVITWFTPDILERIDADATLDQVTAILDGLRPSENLFAGIRVDGMFSALMLRAACPAAPGEDLVKATRHQSEFQASDVPGTLVGFWSPLYTRAVNIPGYHFHFISSDRSIGGHVLDLKAASLQIELHLESDLHLAIPETAEFLTADLAGEHQAALDEAETARHSD